jgi:hypothetical protein
MKSYMSFGRKFRYNLGDPEAHNTHLMSRLGSYNVGEVRTARLYQTAFGEKFI